MAQEVTHDGFMQYAQGPLTEDETFTVELLLDRVYDKIDTSPESYAIQSERSDERDQLNYQPRFDHALLEPSWKYLQKLDWISLQRLSRERPLARLFPLVQEESS
jgi:hypothetical protein